MKYVQSIVNAKVKRVTDVMAERMVASKSWFYIPMTGPTDRHMVFTAYDGHVTFQANWSRHGAVNLSGSEPLVWYGVHTGERIHDIQATDMIEHLLSVFEPTIHEILWEQITEVREEPELRNPTGELI